MQDGSDVPNAILAAGQEDSIKPNVDPLAIHSLCDSCRCFARP